MKKEIWGPAIWKILHVFTIKLKDEFFLKEKQTILSFIFGICHDLPCPYCSQHACS